MSPTKALGRPRHPSLSLDARADDPKQIRLEGQRFSDKKNVQANWGRIQAVETEAYADFFQQTVPVDDKGVLGSGKLYAAFWDVLYADVLDVSCAHESKAPPRDRQLAWIVEELTDVPAVSDLAVMRLKVQLRDADARDKLQVIRRWIDLVAPQGLQFVHDLQEITTDGTVLEEFEGFVDQIDDDTAYVTLKSEHGEILYGEYSAGELSAKGITERRRFRCKTIEEDGEVRVVFEAVPDVPVSKEEEDAIDQRIDELLADDDLDGDY